MSLPRVLVGVKRVIDYNVKVSINPQKNWVVTNNIKHAINPFCEIALEEAIKLKEKKKIKDIIAVSCGKSKSVETLRTALAMGADQAIHVLLPESFNEPNLEPILVAKLLAKIVLMNQVDLVMVGKQSIDDDFNQTGQLLAGILNWPQATCVSKLNYDTFANDRLVEITREIDGGLQTLHTKLPLVMSADLRLNVPRFVSLPNIMKAKKIRIETISASDLGVDLKPRLSIEQVNDPPKRQGGGRVGSVDELITKLRDEAKVI